MTDLFTAVALAFVIEGVLYALFPGPMRQMVARMLEMPDAVVRRSGLIAAALGVLVVWLIRG